MTPSFPFFRHFWAIFSPCRAEGLFFFLGQFFSHFWISARFPFYTRPPDSQLSDHSSDPFLPSTCKVLWDRALTSVQGINSKLSKVPGYMGPVVTERGRGARFLSQHFDSARVAAGLPCGEVYWAQGVPIEYDEGDIPELLRAARWQVQLIPFPKRVRGSVMHLKVRSTSPPPRTLLRVSTQQEIITLHVVPYNPSAPKKPMPVQEPPTTWAAALKSTLGLRWEPPYTGVSTPPSPEIPKKSQNGLPGPPRPECQKSVEKVPK